MEHIKALVWKNETEGHSDRSAGLAAYPCDHCRKWHVGHQRVAPAAYHYTLMCHLDAILESDMLRPAVPRRLDKRSLNSLPQAKRLRAKAFEEPHPLLWFSRNPRWEYSVTKTVIRRARRAGRPEYIERRGRAELEMTGRGLLRFVVPAWCAKLRWSDYLALNPTPAKIRDALARYGDPTEWLATDEPVSLDTVRAIEVYYAGEWCNVAKVTADDFQKYLAERAAVYKQAEESLAAKFDIVAASGRAQDFDLTEAEFILYEDRQRLRADSSEDSQFVIDATRIRRFQLPRPEGR